MTAHTAPPPVTTRCEWPFGLAAAAACAAGLLGLAGFDVGWALLSVLAPLLALAPALARREARRAAVALPERLCVQVGVSTPVRVRLSGRGRDVLLRAALGGRVESARRLAVADVASAPEVTLDVRVDRRGRHHALAVEATSSFPFGLCEARAVREVACEVVARPRPLRRGPWLARALGAEPGDASGARRDPAGEFHSLVEWRPGEPFRRLHAAATLRRGRPVRVDATSGSRRPARVVLLTTGRGAAAPFERAVSAAATLVATFARGGRAVELVLLGAHAEAAQGAVQRGAGAALDALATATRAGGTPEVEGLGARLRRLPGGDRATWVVAGLGPFDDEARLRQTLARSGATLVLCEAAGAPEVVPPVRGGARRRARVS